MKREARWKREQRWHRKFALWPRDIAGTTVWLETYWRRFVPRPPPKTAFEWEVYFSRYQFASVGIDMPWGHWEESLSPPEPAKVVQLRQARL